MIIGLEKVAGEGVDKCVAAISERVLQFCHFLSSQF